MATKITVIGMDALGQSICLALKNSSADLEVVGHDRERERFVQAERGNVAHRMMWNLSRAVEGASLLFLNEPLSFLHEDLTYLAKELTTEAVITDTGSYKAIVMQWASTLLPKHLHFIGSTPFVSVETPSPAIFRKQRYAIIPQADTPEAAVRLLTNAITLMDAEALFMDVAEHDTLMAAVVQLPALASSALLSLTTQSNAWRDLAMMAQNAHRYATILPETDPQALSTLLRYSRQPLLSWLDSLQDELDRLRLLISEEDEGKELDAYFERLIETQARWEKERRKLMSSEEYAQKMEEVKEGSRLMRLFSFGFGNRGKKE